MIKQQEYDWKDSNLALFGSDQEKKVKLESAQSEPAWKGSGEKVGIEIWRIVKFKVQKWPKDDYGKFYEGDSYIILNTYKNEGEEDLEYDVHFWIGKHSTQDEYGTAAYKTVELDTYHNDKPVQHREVQSHESKLFKSYFKELTYMKGGAESGFRNVKPTEYKPRLFHVHGETYKNTVIKEVGIFKQNLNDHDVFILDTGLLIYQINGPRCDKDEKIKALHYSLKLREMRNGRPKHVVVDDHPMRETGIANVLVDGEADVTEEKEETNENFTRKLYRVSDAGGSLSMDKVAEGEITKDMLDPNDVFIVDLGTEVYVWIGDGASTDERKNGLGYAHKYLQEQNKFHSPVTVVNQGRAGQLYDHL